MESSTKKRLLALLNSRKTLVVLCAIITMLGAKVGLDVNDEMVMSIAAVAVALVLAIAGEDMAQKSGSDVASKQIDAYLKERDLSEAEAVRLERELATLRKEKDDLTREYNKRVDEREIFRQERDRIQAEFNRRKLMSSLTMGLDPADVEARRLGAPGAGARMENEGGTPDG